MRYRSRPTEVEAMQWSPANRWSALPAPQYTADQIVAWVITKGGEARYVPMGENTTSGWSGYPRIAVRTINGWAYAAPGHYIVMGSAEFRLRTSDPKWYRDFYPCDPETFEQRWEPQRTEGSEQ